MIFLRLLTYVRTTLKFRKELPQGLLKEFIEYKDINSIDRIRVAAWIAFSLSVLLFPLDFIRIASGEFYVNAIDRYLFYLHVFGLIFILPAWSMTFYKPWVIATSKRRAIHIWGMVVLDFIFLFGMAMLVFWERDSLILYLAFIFITGWMFSMSHKERLIFNLVTFPLMFVIIALKPDEQVSYSKLVMYYEIFFLSVVAFFFDTFDYNLMVSNFLARKTIEKDREKIRRLEKFKSKFFTNLTHELRTPLTVISGMSSVIAENPKRWAAEGTQMISRNAGNLLNVINQILDLSKLEDGSLPVNMVKGDMVSYVGNIVDAFNGHASSKKIGLHFLNSDPEIQMDYDPDKYLSILSNLISNAIRFTPEGGNIYVQLSLNKTGEIPFLEIIVRDTGKGMDADVIGHIFDRFYQADTSEVSFGSGIGLSIVQELVKLLDGEITVNSTVGKGTQFMIKMPVKTDAEPVNDDLFRNKIIKEAPNYILHPENIKEEQEDDAQPDQYEVLIVEDNPDVNTFLQISLGDKFHLTVRNDGQAGIDKAIEMVPDIILSDVMMPVKDGYELCRELKANNITSHIPILLLSSKTDTVSRITGLESGADVYMVKPFDRREVHLQIGQILESRRKLQARYSDPSYFQESNVADDTLEDEFLRKIKEIIYEHLDDSEFGILQLCRKIFVSRTQLHKKLKALTGLSASIFIRQIRLFAARELLKDEQLNVTEIAYRVGFTDPNYFTRCFTQEFGMPPSEWR